MRSGRPPKPADERRNRNTPTHEWVKLPKAGRKGKPPAIPENVFVSAATRKWWKEIWASPMATMWDPKHDVHALIELAILRDKLVNNGAHGVAGEVRIREAEYGLTLAGRRALRWVIEGEEAEMPEAPPSLASVHRLKAVDQRAVARSK